MYKRAEHIEEEVLDWGTRSALSDDVKDDIIIEKKETSSILSWIKNMYSKMQRREIHKNEEPINVPTLSVVKKTAKKKPEKHVSTVAKENPMMVFALSIFLLPFVIGVVISYALSFYYGEMSILDFYATQKSDILFGEWLIGFEITAWLSVVWIVFLAINAKRSKGSV